MCEKPFCVIRDDLSMYLNGDYTLDDLIEIVTFVDPLNLDKGD